MKYLSILTALLLSTCGAPAVAQDNTAAVKGFDCMPQDDMLKAMQSEGWWLKIIMITKSEDYVIIYERGDDNMLHIVLDGIECHYANSSDALFIREKAPNMDDPA